MIDLQKLEDQKGIARNKKNKTNRLITLADEKRIKILEILVY